MLSYIYIIDYIYYINIFFNISNPVILHILHNLKILSIGINQNNILS